MFITPASSSDRQDAAAQPARRPGYRARLYGRYRETAGGGEAVTTPDDAPAGLRDFLHNIDATHFPEDRAARIVDLGCGAGLLVHIAREAGFDRITGVDAAPGMVEAALRLNGDGISLGDALEMLHGLETGSHDAVVSLDLIEHLTRDELIDLADEVHRVLASGGRWVIHTVNAEAPFFGRVRYGDLTHEQAFTQASLRQLLLACDFSAVTCREDRPITHRPAAVLRWLMWHTARLPALLWLIAENGPAARHAILSQNLLAVAVK